MRKKVVVEFFVDVDDQGMIDDIRDGHEGEKVNDIASYVRLVLYSSYEIYHLLEPMRPWPPVKIYVEGDD